ncbi:MAG: diacylglycerol kinase family lipid kinase [Firmicutes bacterium]|nr:diacylglycerol kinase family lipid kinase [Bacillota bacterium]
MKVKVIINPVAGRGRASQAKSQILRALLEYDVELHLEETKGPHHAAEIARQAVQGGFDLIIVAGGDGTVNQVVNGMGEERVPLGVLGCGTGNDFAAALQMPADPVAAVHQIMNGDICRVDLCRVNQRYFVSSAGIGFDGEVAFHVNEGFRWARGKTAYLCSVFKTLFSYRPRRIKLTVDGLVMEFNSLLVAITNSPTYGGGLKINPEARLNDGYFDICAAQHMSVPEILVCLPLLFPGWHRNLKKVRMLKGRSITLESSQPFYYQLDGEILTDQVLRFTLFPEALLVKGAKVEPVENYQFTEAKPARAREA